jgi:hypothetical protein
MSPPATPTEPGAAGRPSFTALFSKALRLAVMLVLVAVGLLLVQTFREMLHETPAAPALPAANRPITDVEPPDFLQPGAWSLGDSSWTLTLTDPMSAEGGARLRSLGFRGEIKDKPSALEENALGWLKKSRPTIVEGCRVYDISAGVARIRAVTRTQRGGERLQMVQAIWQRGGSWQMLEAMPAPTLTSGDARGEHLLPLPSGVPSLARRWSSSGRLTCEILGPTNGLEQTLKAWSAAGWSEERSLEADAIPPLRVLRNGDQVVRLLSMQAGPQGAGDYLLLTTELPHQQGAN